MRRPDIPLRLAAMLAPGARHTVEVGLSEGLQPGQFQGVFLENVEAEFTTEIRLVP